MMLCQRLVNMTRTCHNFSSQLALSFYVRALYLLPFMYYVSSPSFAVIFRGRELALEFILRLKIKRNDWLLADTCPKAANH